MPKIFDILTLVLKLCQYHDYIAAYAEKLSYFARLCQAVLNVFAKKCLELKTEQNPDSKIALLISELEGCNESLDYIKKDLHDVNTTNNELEVKLEYQKRQKDDLLDYVKHLKEKTRRYKTEIKRLGNCPQRPNNSSECTICAEQVSFENNTNP